MSQEQATAPDAPNPAGQPVNRAFQNTRNDLVIEAIRAGWAPELIPHHVEKLAMFIFETTTRYEPPKGTAHKA
jgi:hypothetical protein